MWQRKVSSDFLPAELPERQPEVENHLGSEKHQASPQHCLGNPAVLVQIKNMSDIYFAALANPNRPPPAARNLTFKDEFQAKLSASI